MKWLPGCVETERLTMAQQLVFHKIGGNVSTAKVPMKFSQSGDKNSSRNKLLKPDIIAPRP